MRSPFVPRAVQFLFCVGIKVWFTLREYVFRPVCNGNRYGFKVRDSFPALHQSERIYLLYNFHSALTIYKIYIQYSLHWPSEFEVFHLVERNLYSQRNFLDFVYNNGVNSNIVVVINVLSLSLFYSLSFNYNVFYVPRCLIYILWNTSSSY